ncbi:MAG TPA: alpha/beta fold hydrolase [Acidimicrobiia bacterium]
MVTVGDVELAVTDTGTGPALFYGHGLTSSREQEGASGMFDWRRLAGKHRIVRWDARGHGESGGKPEPGPYRWDNLAGDLLALADSLGIDRFAAGGVSMGAATALHAAVRAPDRVTALVLVLAPTAYETRAAQAGLYRAGADLVETEGVDAYVRLQRDAPVPEILSEFAELYHQPPAVAEDLLPAVLRGAAASDLPDPEAVRGLVVPVLLLAWETDPGHPLSTAERLAELLPAAELHVARELRQLASWTGVLDTFLDGRG